MKSIYLSLPVKCLDSEFFLVSIFGIRIEHGDLQSIFVEIKHAHPTPWNSVNHGHQSGLDTIIF